jgi:hypothetical protein
MARTREVEAWLSAGGNGRRNSQGISEGGMMAVQRRSTTPTRRTVQPIPSKTRRSRPGSRHALAVRYWGVVLGVLLGAACNPTGEGELPPGVKDPRSIQTPTGAENFYRGVLANVFPVIVNRIIADAAVLTDEFVALPVALGQVGSSTPIDSRQDLAAHGKTAYGNFHSLRAQVGQARGFLERYAPDSPPALRGHTYALEAYAEIFLADLFCSGIPLSTVDFEADYTLTAGFTTTEVYTRAVAHFDSALALVSDSARLQHFTSVGRARALLALGQYATAAAAVAAVPDGFVYQVPRPATGSFLSGSYSALASIGLPSMADLEGINGLDYRSSRDPRTKVDSTPAGTGGSTSTPKKDSRGNVVYFPDKYTPVTASMSYVLASGVEARLIEAEAALQAGSAEWLAKLNALRTDGTFTTQPTADPNDDPAAMDTLWHAGGGGVPGLRPLDDPGTADARVNLVFRERAFWLFATGHRQGDLRRLVRQYNRASETVYPTGVYPGYTGDYGNEVVTPVPEEERTSNPKYSGCFHRSA